MSIMRLLKSALGLSAFVALLPVHVSTAQGSPAAAKGNPFCVPESG